MFGLAEYWRRFDVERLNKFVRDYLDGQIFGSWQLDRPEDVTLSFMVLALANPADFPPDAAHVYEYYRKAGPFGINGYPIFWSCHFLSNAQWNAVQPVITAELERRKTITIEVAV